MKRTYNLEDLDCAVCAEKMANAIRKIDGVEEVDVSFLMQKLTVSADESQFDDIMKQVVKACKKVEPDCKILLK